MLSKYKKSRIFRGSSIIIRNIKTHKRCQCNKRKTGNGKWRIMVVEWTSGVPEPHHYLYVSNSLNESDMVWPESFFPLACFALICLFVCSGFSSYSKIFNSYGDVTISGEGLQILTYTRFLWPLSSEGSLACLSYCDTGLPFIKVIFEDPWHSHL